MQKQERHQRSVEELLDMITNRSGNLLSNQSIQSASGRVQPPPVPPKPRTILDNSTSSNVGAGDERVASGSVGSGFGGFRRYFPSKTATYSPIEEANKNSVTSNGKYDAYDEIMERAKERKYGVGGGLSATTLAAVAAARRQHKADMLMEQPSVSQLDKNSDVSHLEPSNSQLQLKRQQPQLRDPHEQPHLLRRSQPQQPNRQEQPAKQDSVSSEMECLAHESTTTLPPSQQASPPTTDDHTINPIVTESPEEANNNNNGNNNYIVICNNRLVNTSTVKISELPPSRQPNVDIAKANDAYGSSYNNQTFNRSQNSNSNNNNSKKQQQIHHHQPEPYYENNSYAAPVITTLTTDDEDGDQSDRNVELLPLEMDEENMLNNGSTVPNNNNDNNNHHHHQQPPRTSTPNQILSQSSSPTSSSTCTSSAATTTNAAATFTNNNLTNIDSNNRVIVHVSRQQNNDYYDNNSDYDALNTSKDTDELNNSALNQSGGGELIGINENSDSAANSRDCTMNEREEISNKTPYTVQEFNETIRSNSVLPPDASRTHFETLLNKTQQHENSNYPSAMAGGQHSPCQERIKELEELTSTLLNNVDKLQNQVVNLTSKIDDLELQVDKQEKSIANINEQCDGSFFRLNSSSNITNQALSKSTSTINRLPSLAVNISGSRQGNGPMSTYLRNNQVTKISKNSKTSPAYSSTGSSGLMSTSVQNYNTTSRGQLSQSISSNTVTKSHRPLAAYASANSLYGGGANENVRSTPGGESISPTPLNHHHHHHSHVQSSSPTSTLSFVGKRDPKAYTSMLSLNSLGQHSAASTLKKASATSDSVSNLSHVSSQLSNWPSISDFVTNKHRAKDLIYIAEENLIRMVLYNTSINMRVPSWLQGSYNVNKTIEKPSARLKLDWVYGYRGRDCRSNIYYLPTGECVYFVASIVVLYNIEEKTQRHYLGHTDSVKCLAIHPNKLIIASGQSASLNRRDKRPIVRVWNTVSLATLRIIGFNEDFDRPICCLAFSKHDLGATLAVVDESNDHTITLLDWEKEKNWRLAETNSGHELVLAIDFHPIDKYSLVAVGKSSINFWDVRGMTLTKKAGLFDKYDKPKYVLCQTFNDFGETITGDSNGNIMIWPRGTNRPQKVIQNAHQGGVFSILAMKNGSYLSGGRDRRVVEWDENFKQTGREAELPEHCGGVRFITYARGSQVLIGTVRNSILLGSLDDNFSLIMQGHAEATSCLAIHPNQPQYLTGGFDEQIHLFDTTTHAVEWSKCLTMPATSASFSPNGYLLIVGSTLGKWLVIDAISQEILFTKCDGSGTINCIKFSPDGQYFSMGSSDSQIYVYQTTEAGNKFCRIGTCVGHSTPIKEIDWSDDSRYMQSQSMNFELLFWKATNCRPLDDENIISDLIWHTHNSTLGFNAIGIWSDSIDLTLISACDKSNNEDLMISASDTGNINIFKWPPCYNQCLSQKYYGNVEKFNFIKFLPDDSKLIAVGSKNCVTTEWIVDKGSV